MEVKGETGGRVIELDGESVTEEIELLGKRVTMYRFLASKNLKIPFTSLSAKIQYNVCLHFSVSFLGKASCFLVKN